MSVTVDRPRPHTESASMTTRSAVPPAAGVVPARHLWSSIPNELVETFRPNTEIMIKAINYEIQCAAPGYARLLEGPFGELVTHAVENAVHHAVDWASGHVSPADHRVKVFRELGEIEFTQGRSLNFLHTAYRIGGRVAWRHLADFGQARGIPTDILCDCAEDIFVYVDTLSQLSQDGYATAKAENSGITNRRRRLLDHIFGTTPVSSDMLTKLAADAGWSLPASVTVVALEAHSGGSQTGIPSRDDVLVDLESQQPYLITSASEEGLDWLEGALPGRRAVVGPTVALQDAARSLRCARQTLDLVRHGVLPDAPVTYCADHLGTLWLLGDRFLMSALSQHSLSPLKGLTEKRRVRLSETLLAWLQTRGGAPELASKLDIHPQTARYRIRQLRELFGDRLNDPDERFSIEITLRAEQLTARKQRRLANPRTIKAKRISH